MTADAAALAELLARRHSCRAFRPEPLPRDLIERMFTLAQRTPSWCNTQPWEVIVTADEGTRRLREALVAAATADEDSDLARPGAYHGRYLDRRRESGYALYRAVGIERSDRAARARQAAENFRLFGAPHAAIVTSDATMGPYGVLDTGGYLAMVALAAQALGIGLVLQAALAMRAGVVRRLLAIPDDRVIVAGFSFGWESTGHPVNGYRTSRADLGEVVRWVER